MKKLLIFLLILGAQQIKAQNTEIEWIGFEALEDSLKVKTKPVVIYFYTDWCVYCKKMDKNAFKNSEVISELNEKFYAVKMNAESTDVIEFEGQIFTNEQAKIKRNGIHQIPLLLASRKNKPISFPVIMVLDENFRVKKKSHEYLTSDQLKSMIKG